MRLVCLALSLALSVPAIARAYDTRHVFITNRLGGNLVELDEDLVFQRTWFDGETFDGLELSVPNGMAFTPTGEIFIADSGNSRIVALDEGGNFVRAFSTTARMGGGIESIYFDGAGVMYASANPGTGIVARFTDAGANLADVVNDPSFLNLANVNLTAAGFVIVSDFSGGLRGVREIDPATGVVVRTFGTDLMRQEDMMIDGGDRLFVAHYEGDEVVVYGPAPEREELYRFSAPADAGLALERATGIALTVNCEILVSSFTNGSIFVFHHNGGETPPTFERVLRPGMEIPASAMLGSTESIAISGLGLPGSFEEFVDRVPSCDPTPPLPDAGPTPDAGRTDSGISSADAGAADVGRTPRPSSDCGCRAPAGSPTTPVCALAVIAGLLIRRARRT